MSGEPRYLVIDQGGHASRAFLYEGDGRLLAAADAVITTHHPAPDRVEHDPEEMVASVREAVAAVLHKAGEHEVAAAGLAVQRSSVVCWDRRNGQALSPVLSWQDRRNAAWLQRLQDRAAEIKRRTGLPLSPHFGAGKLRWCWDHLPAVRAAAQAGHLAWGPLASFLVFRLTAQHSLCADSANASRTLLCNLDSSDWDPHLAQWFGVDSDALPPCVPTRYPYGDLGNHSRRLPLTLVTGDQSAALFAAESGGGHAAINLGTGAFLQQAITQRPPDTPLLTSLAYRDDRECLYALEGTVNGAGCALAWAAEQLGMDQAMIIRELPAWLEHSRRPPLFLNGVGGLGTPYLNPLFTPHFVGKAAAAEQCVAVIESIVFLLQVNLEEMAGAGAPLTAVTLSGGLSRLDGLCQRLADLSGIPVFRPADHEATARGLLYLLSGTRPAVAQSAFSPQRLPSLAQRYRDWRQALEGAIAAQA